MFVNQMTGYKNMLNDLGLTQTWLDFITNSGEVVEFKSKLYYKDKSDIHGYGIFSVKNLLKGDVIGLGSIDSKYKTILGRYVNHSDNNNAKFYYLKNDDLVMVAEKDISKKQEILVNYRDHTLKNERFI